MSHIKGESLRIILIILLGWSCFSFADATSKYLTQDQEFSPSLLLAYNGLIGAIGLITWIFIHKGWRGFLSPNWKWLIARGVCIAGTATGVVNALSLIPLADVYGITFSAPFIAVCMAYILLKEQVGWHRWMATIVGFIGVVILLGPQFSTLNTGIIYAIIAALSIAIGTIVIRKIGKNEYLPLFILYPYMGILAVNLPLAWLIMEVPPLIDSAWFMANALFVLGGQLFITFGIANAKSTASVAPFVYLQIVWGVIFGYLFFNEFPTTETIIGLILIVGAGLYMIYRERQLRLKVNH